MEWVPRSQRTYTLVRQQLSKLARIFDATCSVERACGSGSGRYIEIVPAREWAHITVASSGGVAATA